MAMMNQAWREPGFCVPNQGVYPHQWLWDSCFHSVVWTRLGHPDRAATELESALAHQGESGFVPHMIYWSEPDAGAGFWGRPLTSSITQPPMFGLALTELAAVGHQADDLVDRAGDALLHLLDARLRTPGGLIPVFHPWETGCDDSPRWDSWATADGSGPVTQEGWMVDKIRFVSGLRYDVNGAPVANDEFAVGSIGFNALVAWNAMLVARLSSDGERGRALEGKAVEVTDAIRSRWSPSAGTWIDEPAEGPVRPSCSARTLDGLLALLVDPRPEAFDQLSDPTAFGGEFGPAGVHRSEPSFDPNRYWRGPAWPQMTYLLWRAACQHDGTGSLASELARRLRRGAARSGFAEYWNPDTGEGLGARPQTWAGLAVCCT